MDKEKNFDKWMAHDLSDFYEHLYRQIGALFLLTAEERSMVESVQKEIDTWFLTICATVSNKYYAAPSMLWPLHNSQFSMFLYIVARTLYVSARRTETTLLLCDKLYNLNKMASGAEIHYAVALPRHFFTDHPYGTGLGHTIYGDHLLFIQGVTVGSANGAYPVLGDCVALMSHCKLLGNCRIGNNVIIGPNAFVKNRDIPDDSIVFGQDGDLIVKTDRREKNRAFFRGIFLDLKG